jgi:hypothetical protein
MVQVSPAMSTASVTVAVIDSKLFGLCTTMSPVRVHAVGVGVPRVTSTV